ncbi:MAG: EAL domain-containing protein [Xanthomonadales bacterium]|nr:EAL domain-containing protein [Xanthomonadales bacterium]MBK7145568.1 EAL domain-containing protein [Xanthomonadales bacterium]
MKPDPARALATGPASPRQLWEDAVARLADAIAALEPEAPAAQPLRRARDRLEALLRSTEALESRYRTLLDAVPEAVTVHDRHGHILEANRTAEGVYGYPLEQLRRLRVQDLNPTLPDNYMEQVFQTFQVGRTETVETSNRHGDGHYFPIEVHSRMFLDGEEMRIIAVVRDVSARLRAESELRASERRYRKLFDAVDKGILVQDQNGRVTSANAAAERMLGMQDSELRAEALSIAEWRFVDAAGRALKPRDLPPLRAISERRAIQSTVIGINSPALGGYSWFSVTAVPQFRDDVPAPFEVITLFSDITALMLESVLFDEVQSLASIGGWHYDFRRRRMYGSRELHRLLELPRDGVLEREAMYALFVPGDRERLRTAMDAARLSSEAFDLELRIVTASGQRRWLRVIGQPQLQRGAAESVIGTAQDVSARKRQEEQLRRQALTDSLTGLSNRDALMRALALALDEAQPGSGPALLYVDLDRFKVINDLLGHAAGDGLLVAAAQRLRRALGPNTLLARFGGDEFMIMIAPCSDEVQARDTAVRITTAFAEPFPHSGEEFSITASVGVAHYPQDGATIQQLINHADAAMFDAKRRGRNNWQAFSPALARKLTDRLLIETQLRRALDNQEFYLRYQPQVDLRSGRVTAAEALIRWRNRVLGELAPDLFISHAENTGDIVRIGVWVIREACRQLRLWHDAGLTVPRVAVNVSYRQFLSDNLPEVVAAALHDHGLQGCHLELEMTERVLVEDVPDTLEIFRAIKQLGVSLVIDDFGEGYSALNYLRQLPFDGLKISHHFMQGIPATPSDTAICEAIIRIAQSLGMTVIAEGVEMETQRQFLLRQGTTLAQGFLFSRPIAPDEIADFVRLHGCAEQQAG